ncbi:hypothetical protein [Polyangium sp. 15x6]|uniref:hypothetical protein n=1 Tax=Polyangium sp. 15x6 TaxID=3042687 RepID=UPI00249A7EC7|nr:hypothetical protein [Polyangium sp. 15x6]MDI3290275.1 hypothetical protein [Polyangium sp. 15x6]
MLRLPYLALVSTLALTGCTGLTFGENNPGQDTWLEDGSIAVDDRTETSYVLAGEAKTDAQNPYPTSTLFAVDPDSGLVRTVEELSGRTDPRLLFPASGLLVMSEANDKDRIDLYDHETLALKKSVDLDIRYHGTRMSPSRKFIGVADNTSDRSPIHIIEAETLDRHVVPHDGEWLELNFMNKSDTFVSIVFYDQSTQNPRARLLGWSMEQVASTGYQLDETGKLWTAPLFDIDVPNTAWDIAFSWSYVGISPDDKYVVFPVQKTEAQPNGELASTHMLLVLDTMTKEVREVPGKGPVGFAPDGSTIVSYGDQDNDGNQELWLIDAITLETEQEPVKISGGINYFISRDGNYVVVAPSATGTARLVLYDVDQDKSTQMDGPHLHLDEFVTRVGHKEMWLVEDESLYRIDLVEATATEVLTSFAPEHVNILPKRDRLVLDDASSNNLFFFDPNIQGVKSTVGLPVSAKTSP